MDIKHIMNLARQCMKDNEEYIRLREVHDDHGVQLLIPRMDDNHDIFVEEVRKLNLDNPESFMLFCGNVIIDHNSRRVEQQQRARVKDPSHISKLQYQKLSKLAKGKKND